MLPSSDLLRLLAAVVHKYADGRAELNEVESYEAYEFAIELPQYNDLIILRSELGEDE